MSDLIARDDAIALIETKQKELCPVGRYGRGKVDWADREKYDAWQEIIDALEALPTINPDDIRQMGRWEMANNRKKSYIRRCSACEKEAYFCGRGCSYKYCPNCGAKMNK